MTKYKFEFEGGMFYYFLCTIVWGVLITITLGLAVPFYIVWNFKWFVENLKIIKQRR